MKASTQAAPESKAAWHVLSPEQVVARLETDQDKGLSAGEATRRRTRWGPNRLPEPSRRSAFRMFLDQFANLLVLILTGAAAVSGILGELRDALAIAAIVLINAVIGYLQERRAAGALEALRRMTAPTTRVRRGGEPCILQAAELVPGDVVVLEAGDQVPADIRLVRSSATRTIELALTGESEPVEKEARAKVEPATPPADRRNMLFMGTAVASGLAEGVVVETGVRTEFGRIAELMRTAEDEETPLQARLRTFGKWLVVGSGLVVALVFVLGLLRGVPAVEMLLASISLAVAAVPEGLPAVVTVALALGVHRMARKRALVRRLASVETLGCTSVICSDKTGTLTMGQMTVRHVSTCDEECTVEGEGYQTKGRILRQGSPETPPDKDGAYFALWAGVACSTARLIERSGNPEIAGDPTEGALIVAAKKAGIDQAELESREPIVSSRPFDSDRKLMSVVRRTPSGLCSYVKGAPEAVLARCTSAGRSQGIDAMDLAIKARIEGRNGELARNGLRVLAVAIRNIDDEDDPETGLMFIGLIAMQDPPRPEAREAVSACRRAGIRPVMITGDNPRTAFAIARDLDIAHAEMEVVTGPEVEAMSDLDLARKVGTISVYARVSPEHKLRIVRAWKAQDAVVAMTGDGVNDAPALKGADIGIAMGKTGTDVARDAAAMVITDDNFATIVAAVEEGRAVFENIRKTLLYLLSGNVAEILIMAAAVVAGWPIPLLPIQLLWINLVTDGLPALALVTDPADPDLLKRRPRRPGQEIADRDFLLWMVASGLLIAICTLAGFLYGLKVEGSLDQARTYAFSTLVIGEVLRAFASRSRTRVLWELGLFSNARLAIIAILTISIQLLSHHVGFLESFLKTGPLTWGNCFAILALAAVPVTVLELWKLARRSFPGSPAMDAT